jgi:PAS domain S-box-containing protein
MKSNSSAPRTEPTSSIANHQVLQLFLDSITDQAVFTVDLDGVITSWNQGCYQVKGYTSAEAIGQNFGMLYTLADRTRGHPADNLSMARVGGQFHEEGERVRKSTEQFMAEVSIYPIEKRGIVTGFAKIVKDVSERSQLQVQHLLLETELRRSNTELEEFCQSVAHDLRTPVRAIVTRCKIMQEDIGELLPENVLTQFELLVQKSLNSAQASVR